MGDDPATPTAVPPSRRRREVILIVAVGVGATLAMILVDYFIGAC